MAKIFFLGLFKTSAKRLWVGYLVSIYPNMTDRSLIIVIETLLTHTKKCFHMLVIKGVNECVQSIRVCLLFVERLCGSDIVGKEKEICK